MHKAALLLRLNYMRKLLLIIDPQIDFITGTLPVPGAAAVMDSLAQYVADKHELYTHIVVTADRHPFRHCSFIENGGQWPRHCIHDSVGAATHPTLMSAQIDCGNKVTYLHKGQQDDKEEYSIFSNTDATKRMIVLVGLDNIDRIDICGLAGDVCVAATIHDGITIFGKKIFNVLTRYTASIDGGKTLDSLISNYDLSCDR